MSRRAAELALSIALLVSGACADREAPALPGAALPSVPADAPTDLSLDLRAVLSADAGPLFEEVQLAIDLFVAAGIELATPFEPALPEGFEGELTRPRAEAAGSWQRFSWTLRPVELGALPIEPFEVRDASGEHVATTRALTFEVTSLLATGDASDTGDPAADAVSVEAPSDLLEPRVDVWPRVLLGALAVLGIVLAIYSWRRFANRARVEPASVPLPPHVKALRALAALRDAPRGTAGEVETFYVELSQVLRVYLEERFGLRAPERTTEEFLPEVEQSGLLAVSQALHLRQFLEQCDLVKFAAMRPDDRVHDATFAFAEELVESTRADRLPQPAEIVTEGAA